MHLNVPNHGVFSIYTKYAVVWYVCAAAINSINEIYLRKLPTTCFVSGASLSAAGLVSFIFHSLTVYECSQRLPNGKHQSPLR
jgi:hypothetical protein